MGDDLPPLETGQRQCGFPSSNRILSPGIGRGRWQEHFPRACREAQQLYGTVSRTSNGSRSTSVPSCTMYHENKQDSQMKTHHGAPNS